jgi:hypothetical protein
MDTAAEFRKYAANCKKMSRVSKDPEIKALWRRMAARWLLCAKLVEEEERSAARLHEERLQSELLMDSPMELEIVLP